MTYVLNGYDEMRKAHKEHYEDMIAYFLRYPEVMFNENIGLPIFPEDFNDAYAVYQSEKAKYPTRNFQRGPDVGYQNLMIEKYTPSSSPDLVTTGPTLLSDLVPFLIELKTDRNNPNGASRPPFIRVSLKSLIMANRLRFLGSEGGEAQKLAVWQLPLQDFVDQLALELTISGYVPLGDILFARSIKNQINTFLTPNGTPSTFPHAVFARRDICQTVPVASSPVAFSKYNRMVNGYSADLTHPTLSKDMAFLYADVGYTLNNKTKYVVLRCFLERYIETGQSGYFGYSDINYIRDKKPKPTWKTISEFEYRSIKENYDYQNDLHYQYYVGLSGSNNAVHVTTTTYDPSIRITSYSDYVKEKNNFNSIFRPSLYRFMLSPDKVLLNLAKVLTNNSSDANKTFQKMYFSIDGKLQRVDNAARMIVEQICADPNLVIEGYPNLCACVGTRKTEEMRRLLKNSAYRPVCHDADCLNTQDKKVFRYTPELPCSNVGICTSNIDIDTNKLKITNVKLDCVFKDAELPLTPPTTALPLTTLPMPTAASLAPRSSTTWWFAAMCVFVVLLIAVLLNK